MTTVQVVKREVEKLKEKVQIKPPIDIVVVFSFGPDKEPHGKHGYRKLHIHTGKYEACDLQDELRIMKEYYDDLDVEMRMRQWPTFQDFCRDHECKCGRHG